MTNSSITALFKVPCKKAANELSPSFAPKDNETSLSLLSLALVSKLPNPDFHLYGQYFL